MLHHSTAAGAVVSYSRKDGAPRRVGAVLFFLNLPHGSSTAVDYTHYFRRSAVLKHEQRWSDHVSASDCSHGRCATRRTLAGGVKGHIRRVRLSRKWIKGTLAC